MFAYCFERGNSFTNASYCYFALETMFSLKSIPQRRTPEQASSLAMILLLLPLAERIVTHADTALQTLGVILLWYKAMLTSS